MIASAAKLARAFHPSTSKLATILFSGPADFELVGPCQGQVEDLPNASLFDPLVDCGIKWVTRFNENKSGEEMASDIENLVFPQGSTSTSMALAEASNELMHGRANVETFVIVLTGGTPTSSFETSVQAEKLKSKAGLIWVLAGDGFEEEDVFHEWASPPSKDHIERVHDFHQLPSP